MEFFLLPDGWLFKTIFSLFLFSSVIFSQDFTGIKICVNPGHGGHDSDDRFISQTGFYESDGNLAKGLHLRDILESMGATIIMTRTQNRTQDDIALSQIVSIANSNNVDYMHSIHSNGFNGQLNYTLILFQGGDNAPTFPGAKVMGNYLGAEIKEAHRTIGGPYNRGDFDFYGTGQPYLGVFRNLTMPGTLSEGSFHDYIPESWRLKSSDYNKHEAWAITKSFIKYFNKPALQTGFISGVVREADQNVSYFYLSNSNDGKKPVNNIKVRLEPGGRVIRGDNENNGFYLFDSVAAGQYTVYFETEGYSVDSAVVNVTANQNTYADAYVVFNPTAAPVVLSYSPKDTIGGVYTTSPIIIEFNRQMNRASTQNAFSISPEVQGTFSWELTDKKLIYKPTSPLDTSTTYNVTIASSALSNWNIPLDSAFSFSFTTKSRSKLNVVSSYPNDGEDDVSTTVQIRFEFDGPVVSTSTQGNVALFNSSRISQTVKNIKFFNENGRGYIYFEPGKELNEDSTYYVELRGGITDEEGFKLHDTVKVNFTTFKKPQGDFQLLDTFDSLSNWQIRYVGVDTSLTSFTLAADRKISGSYSGKLSYKFDASQINDILLQSKNSFVFGTSDTVQTGLWIFGDNSNNKIGYRLGDTLSSDFYFVDSLNWTGWKLKLITAVDLESLANNYFYFSLAKGINGADSGSIYIDDLVYSDLITDIDEFEVNPSRYVLFQNYPNPFNPETMIKYSVPERSNVSLKIFDALGREVAVLVNEEKQAGIYAVSFNMNKGNQNLSSGVYFYTLSSGSFSSTKKLILMK